MIVDNKKAAEAALYMNDGIQSQNYEETITRLRPDSFAS